MTAHIDRIVWILTAGEDYEGGSTQGVYADKSLAFADFLDLARGIDERFGLDSVKEEADGAVYAHGGCDWVRLDPHQVVERNAIAGDPIAEVASLIHKG